MKLGIEVRFQSLSSTVNNWVICLKQYVALRKHVQLVFFSHHPHVKTDLRGNEITLSYHVSVDICSTPIPGISSLNLHGFKQQAVHAYRSIECLRKLCFRLKVRFKTMCFSFQSTKYPEQVLLISDRKIFKKREHKHLMTHESSSQS